MRFTRQFIVASEDRGGNSGRCEGKGEAAYAGESKRERGLPAGTQFSRRERRRVNSVRGWALALDEPRNSQRPGDFESRDSSTT